MNEIIVGGGLVRRRGEQRLSAGTVLGVGNLRQGDDGRLVPVGQPLVYGALAGSRPLCRLNGTAGPLLLCAAGKSLLTVPEGMAGAAATTVPDALPGEAFCAMPRGTKGAIVMTSAGAVEVSAESGQGVAVTPVKGSYPPLLLRAREASPVSTVVPMRMLNSTYNAGGVPDSRDAEALVADLSAAYLRLCASAAATGAIIQPALCRYRLRNKYGHVLYTSPPVLLGAASGAQCASTIGLMSADRHRVESYTLTADTWSLELSIPGGAYAAVRAEVSDAEILMSPLFHPYHPAMPAEVSAGRGSDASSPFLYVGLPGRQCGLGDDFGSNTRSMLMHAIARIDALERCVAVVADPYGRGGTSVTIDVAADGDVAAASRSLHAALSKPAERQPLMRRLLTAPHTFCARQCASDASTAVWADLTVRRAKPYSLGMFAAASSGGGAWSATTVVKFGNGSGTMFTESGTAGAPSALTPVLSYPSPDATEMTVTLTHGGQSYTRTFPLEADESGSCAVYVAERVGHITLPAGVAAPQSLADASERFADALAFTPAANPYGIDAVATLGGGEVKAVVARTGNDQSWEFGRSRFIAGNDSGIYSATTAAGRKTVAIRTLSGEGISRSDAMAPGAHGEVFALTGDSGNEGPALAVLGASGKMSLLGKPRHYTALAYNAVEGELWALRGDGSADVFCRGRGYDCYMRNAVDFDEVVYASGEPFGLSGSGLVSICRETAAAETDVEMLVATAPRNFRRVLPRRLMLHAVAGRISGTLGVEGADESAGNAWPVASCSLNGACRGSLGLALVSRRCRTLVLRLKARVSPDFVFRFFRLNYE